MDGRLDFYEFSEYFQQSSASQTVFESLDINGDHFIMKEEIMMAMRMLEEETAEGMDSSENTPEGNAETQSSSASVSVPPPRGMGPGTEASAPPPDTSGSPSATDLLKGK